MILKTRRDDALCSAVSCLVHQPVYFLFLSTIPDITMFAPSSSAAKSARARQVSMQVPITELPFDCSEAFLLDAGRELKDLSTGRAMANFGRPL